MHPTTITIDTGCICCSACVGHAPQVFDLTDGSAIIRGAVCIDGVPGSVAALLPEVAVAEADAIREAAEGCPIGIIHLSAA